MGRGSSKAGRGSGGGGFTEFSDMPDGTHTYAGDGAKTDSFFSANSNIDELEGQMTKRESNAFKAWTIGGFMGGQQYGNLKKLAPSEKENMQIYDKYLDQSTLKKGVVVTRLADAQLVLGAGKKKGSAAAFSKAEGSVVKCPANMSFAAAKQGLQIGGGKTVEYRLKIKGGTKGAGMYIGREKLSGWGNNQREFMTNRDSYFKVGKTTHDSKRNVDVVELEYMGHDKHSF